MIETMALTTVSRALSMALGGSSGVKTSIDARRPKPSVRTALMCAGDQGRLLRIEVDGWGAAFERRRITMQAFVDLQWDVERMVSETLTGTEQFVRSQNSRRIRAAALGIDGPLDEQSFADPTRLRIDVAVAEALHAQFGSDAAVRNWTVDQLRRFVGRYDAGCVIQVRGRTLAVPIELSSQEVVTDRSHQWDRPCWIDSVVSISPYGPDERERALAAMTDMIAMTPLKDRPLVEGSAWPTEELRNAIGQAKHLRGIVDDERTTTEWRFALEPRMIGFAEAFC